MDFKLLGSILLIVGTSIGAGMLALPIATAQLGFVGSLALLFGCWFVMTAGAFLILEVNLWLSQNSNLISMAKVTIGPVGQMISWVTYLLLLYSLLCAYIAGGSDLFHNLLLAAHLPLSSQLAAFIFTAFFSVIVYSGIHIVDYVNRGLMFFKLGAFFVLIVLLTPFISFENIATSNIKHITSTTAIMVTMTSFGFAAIVPSLRIYFQGNVRKLKIAIMVGSLIPLLCYIAWDAVIMGIIPLHGDQSLTVIMQSQNSTSSLVNVLNAAVANHAMTFLTKLFTSICVVTSFLGVGICLTDFLADGFQVEKVGSNKVLIQLLTFVPPLVIVLFFPNLFVRALEYAGIYCVILLVLLPAWMAWSGRYKRKIANGYTVIGGKWLLFSLIVISLGLVVKSFL